MPKRQEQEKAQDEVTEVARDVLRMQLPIRMPGLGHVNCYAIVDKDGAALVDPGLPGPGTWRALKKRLKSAGLRVGNVHTVIVTHSHADHFGGAVRLAREAGARVIAHRSFRFGLGSDHPEVSADDLAAQRESEAVSGELSNRGGVLAGSRLNSPSDVWNRPSPWGGTSPKPTLRNRLKWGTFSLFRGNIVPAISDPTSGGEVLRLAGREWFVVHTPGHTEDHICLHDPSEEIFLSGDHVLPTITPHISGLSLAKDPLNEFFESLNAVAQIPHIRQALPAHGHPFFDLAGRAEAIRVHHVERLEKVKKIGRELGPASVMEFSQKLFRKRSWGSMAESETYAHLEHLRHSRDAEVRNDREGRLIYETG